MNKFCPVCKADLPPNKEIDTELKEYLRHQSLMRIKKKIDDGEYDIID
ncbi:hypothetical protein N8148_03045 [Gammaproteobacteria bacterium]|nr:hypothetical protein [Gammaproteobacteria bacterium]